MANHGKIFPHALAHSHAFYTLQIRRIVCFAPNRNIFNWLRVPRFNCLFIEPGSARQ